MEVDTMLEGTSVSDAADQYIEKFMAEETDSFFGGDKAPEAEKKAEPAPKESAPAASEEQEQDQAEGEKPEAESTSEEEDTSTETEEAASLDTLTELAEQLEVPLEDIMANISHTYRAAGEEHTATLADLVKGNQFQADYNRSKEALATTRKQLEQDHRERAENYSKQLNDLGAHFKVVDEMLNESAESPELLNLKEVNPAEYVMRVMDLDKKKQALNQKWQEAVQQNDAIQTQNRDKFFAGEIAKVEEQIDDWGPAKSTQFIEAVRAMGFEDVEIPGLIDHRVILSVLEMQGLREKVKDLEGRVNAGQKTAAKVKKTVPKMLKPGKGSAKVSASNAALDRARKAMKKNPSARNAASVWDLEQQARDK